MNIQKAFSNYSEVPISRNLMLEILKEYKSPNDKISELVKKGILISLRRGLYITGTDLELPQPNSFLIANHLRGPSYVSLETALSYWGLIPERVYEIASVTLKNTIEYNTPVGRFSFHYAPSPYYSFGIKSIKLSDKQKVLVATKEKAICDKIIFTKGLTLRSTKQVKEFLMEDLRIERGELKKLNAELIELWIENAPKKSSIIKLIKTLKML